MYGMCDGKTSYVALSRGMREAVQHCIIIYCIQILHVQINVLLTNFNPARLNTILKVQITKAILLYSNVTRQQQVTSNAEEY